MTPQQATPQQATPQQATPRTQREAPPSANAQRQRPAPTADAKRQPGSPRSRLSGVEPQPNLLYRYLFWTYERGSFHYDVMVTLILLFLFLAPHFIDFHDRPIPEVPARSAEVLVRDAGMQGSRHKFVYEIRAEDLHDIHSGAELDTRIAEKVNNITPGAEISAVKPVKDPRGRTVGYDATVLR